MEHRALKRNDDHWTLAEELRGAQDPAARGLGPGVVVKDAK